VEEQNAVTKEIARNVKAAVAVDSVASSVRRMMPDAGCR
jgi:hypothetical protein